MKVDDKPRASATLADAMRELAGRREAEAREDHIAKTRLARMSRS